MPVAGRASTSSPLATGDVLHAAEFAGVGGADAKDHSDVGADHLREVADVADAGGAHLDHEVAGVAPALKTVSGTPTSPL